MRPAAITELKILIGAVLTVAVAAQVVVLPMLAAEAAASFPEVAYLRTPLTALAVVAIACGEAALVCIWRLLTLSGRGAFLTSRTTRWVDALVLSLVAGTGMLAAISAVLTADPQTGGGGPAVGLGLMAGMFLGAAAILGLLVWRGRLLQSVRDAAKQQRRVQL
ncbi:DUF2975 domain-containing protein [Arthrobacter gengyunqii]|uniref:DUF2975 domain-containing protein n=1 Tax=Arthrobacter gengyunqii TaxID=2886940 RepID=A0A9X1M1Y6_9MICC|nr:DUF2975 domain-containing protein [Arthrobacter gengyunqii]MCC3269492.1 DUF2975 domain-containing protein [Arthrobacter gengyunqii]UOY97670.1 DUF2975 domain-containing protein [Arthrobacter gengyunqii]